MSTNKQFDFWYAVNNTELVVTPTSRLETFGDTVVNYYLVCELMDSTDKVCVREGHLKALKPAIVTPAALGQMDVGDLPALIREIHRISELAAEAAVEVAPKPGSSGDENAPPNC